ncbi:hypothetical protein DFH09DRAFT_1493318 [Mycena vulgaris]|nr:hypothetical protein DFH09DRAFT_1493318 [Mycena vulgaris]
MERISRVRPRSDSTSLDQEPAPQRRKSAPSDAGPSDSSMSPASKDEKYYRTDGDCTIRIEDTLFKIHRYHLSDNSSIFQSMFELPAGSLPSEVSGILVVLVFESKSASDPPHVRRGHGEIISFAHKYLLHECLLWALESIEHILIHYAAMLSAPQYPMILKIAALCTTLHAPIYERIYGLLKRQWVVHIQSNVFSIREALDIADSFNLRSFLVDLYCIILDSLAVTPDPFQAARAADGPLAGISSTHKLRIFSGNWVLSRCWRTFLKQPVPNLTRRLTCAAHRRCDVVWNRAWGLAFKTAEDSDGHPGDIVQKLDEIKSLITQEMTARKFLCSGEMEIDNAIAAFKASLSTHFLCAST